MSAALLLVLAAVLCVPASRGRRLARSPVSARIEVAATGTDRSGRADRRRDPGARLPLIAAVATGLLIAVVVPGPVSVPAGLIAAVLLFVIGRAVLPVLSRRVPRTPPAPLALDLVAACLRAGATLPDALTAAADDVRPPPSGETGAHAREAQTALSLRRVAGLLRMGAPSAEAWAGLPDEPAWRVLGVSAVRSSDSGLRLAAALERVAADLRVERRAADLVRAQRCAVLALLPVGLCFLPAFVCLGVVPVVAGVAGAVFGP